MFRSPEVTASFSSERRGPEPCAGEDTSRVKDSARQRPVLEVPSLRPGTVSVGT